MEDRGRQEKRIAVPSRPQLSFLLYYRDLGSKQKEPVTFKFSKIIYIHQCVIFTI